MRPTTQIEDLSKCWWPWFYFPVIIRAASTVAESPFSVQNVCSSFCWLQQTAASENNLVKYAALQSRSEPELCSNVTKASRADCYRGWVGGGGVSAVMYQASSERPTSIPGPASFWTYDKGCSSSEAAGARLLSARTKPPSAAPGSEDTINLAVCWAARPLTYLRFD